MTDIEKAIFSGLDRLRAQGRSTGPAAIAEVVAGLPARIPHPLLVKLLASEFRKGLPLFPEWVADFLAEVAKRQGARRVVDPWCDAGVIAAAVARVTDADVTGISILVDLHRVLERTDARVTWTVGNAVYERELIPVDAELIVCCPPFNAPVDTAASGHGPTMRDLAGTLVLRSAEKLVPDGRMLFVMPVAAWQREAEELRSALKMLGCEIDACLSLPPGAFAPMANLRTVIVSAVRHEGDGKLFVAEVNTVEGHNKVVLDNWWSKTSARDIAAGRWVDPGTFTSLEHLIARERIEHLGRRSGAPVKLSEIATLATATPTAETLEDTIAVPTNDASRKAVLLDDGVPEKGKFLWLRVDPLKASAPFLARYLNSEIGTLTRTVASRGGAMPTLLGKLLLESPFYLPPLGVQREVAEVSARVRTLTAQLDDLEHRAWREPRALAEVREQLAKVNHSDGLVPWLDTLPFPLGGIVWVLVTQKEPKDRIETLFHLFEAYAQFWATILLSIYLSDEAQLHVRRADLRDVLKRNNHRLEAASFGTWVTLIERVAKELRRIGSADPDSRDLVRRQAGVADQRSMDLLLSKEALGIMKATNVLRNTWKGHAGILGDAEARDRARHLEVHLDKLRAAVGDAWRGYALVRPTKTMEFGGGVYQWTIEVVSGARAPFRNDVVSLASPLEKGRLHMLGDGARQALPLLSFVRLMPSPKTASNACYFYNRREGADVRYVSYHYDEDSDITVPADDVAGVLQSLADGGAG